MARKPAVEIELDVALVRRLLAEQHPDLAGFPLSLANEGWDNFVWRLGDHLAVRLPRRAVAASLIENEQRWLPHLAARVVAAVPVALPVPVRLGRPTAEYPWSWSVVPWLAGTSAATAPPAERGAVAEPLADVVRALHVPAPDDAPHNPVRGIPLAGRDEVTRARIASGGVPRGGELAALWDELLEAEPWPGPPMWLHGDLHPHNLLLDEARNLAAVVDFGDMTAGDPATDLATAWMTFDAAGRARFRARLTGCYDDATWRRARAWALSMATAMATINDDDPVIAAVGAHVIEQVLAD